MVPVVGELMDIAVIVDSTEPTWARVLSGVSLGVNAVTFGALPNFGGLRRGASRVVTTVARRMCFEAGTLVATLNGPTRIEELMPGDLVYAYEEATGTIVIREVVQTFRRVASSLVDLTVADPEDGSESTISGTAEHPFFVPAFGEYVAMGDLYEGMELLGADGESLVVVRRERREGQFEVFNFEVRDAHNYFVVGDGDEAGLLVHSTCARLAHSFDNHAHEWFGRAVRRATHLDQWRELVERASRSNVRFAWRVGDMATEARLATIDGKRFMVQFFTEGPNAGKLATAFIPNQTQMARIRRLLD